MCSSIKALGKKEERDKWHLSSQIALYMLRPKKCQNSELMPLFALLTHVTFSSPIKLSLS